MSWEERLQNEVQKLQALASDPQSGLVSWHLFLNERVTNIVRIVYGPYAQIVEDGVTKAAAANASIAARRM